MSYYRTVTVHYSLQRQLEGIKKLKELAEMMNGHDAPTEILTNFAGDSFRLHVVSRFETLAQFEALNAWAATDATYQIWLQSVQDLFDWNRTQTNLYQVLGNGRSPSFTPLSQKNSRKNGSPFVYKSRIGGCHEQTDANSNN